MPMRTQRMVDLPMSMQMPVSGHYAPMQHNVAGLLRPASARRVFCHSTWNYAEIFTDCHPTRCCRCSIYGQACSSCGDWQRNRWAGRNCDNQLQCVRVNALHSTALKGLLPLNCHCLSCFCCCRYAKDSVNYKNCVGTATTGGPDAGTV